MLTGIELGQAIEAARLKKGITKKALAEHFGVKPPTIQDWVNRGTISKEKLPGLWALFANVVGPEHWGLTAYPGTVSAGLSVMVATESAPPQTLPARSVRPVYVCGTCQGGMPERIFDDNWLSEATEFAEVLSSDDYAFVCRVVGDSMIPKYMPNEYALVEPSSDPDLEDDVLVRLADGSTMLKRLLSRRGGWRFGSYNSPEVLSFSPTEVTWVYYVPHPVPARKIKPREELPRFLERIGRTARAVPVQKEQPPGGKYFSDRPMPGMERIIRTDESGKEKKS
jgi:hypothetical protein